MIKYYPTVTSIVYTRDALKRVFLLFCINIFACVVYAQELDTTDIYHMSLEDIMNIKIISASKKSESLFEAPLSASVLTREEIQNAGSTYSGESGIACG